MTASNCPEGPDLWGAASDLFTHHYARLTLKQVRRPLAPSDGAHNGGAPNGGGWSEEGHLCGACRQRPDRRHKVHRVGLYGLEGAGQPADSEHPFGYSREHYFWSFVVAILLFAVSAGVPMYGGIRKLLDPHEIASPFITHIVLGARGATRSARHF